MDSDKILEGIAALLWPVIVILLVFLFKPAVATLIESAKSRKFTLKIGGQELTMEEANKQQSTIISDLQSQVVEIKKRLGIDNQPIVASLESQQRKCTIQQASILWVDDQPKNNSYFVQQLSDKRLKIELALSTAEGLKKFDHGQYSIVISDMGRTEDNIYNPTAGLELLKAIRAHNSSIPLIIFSSSSSAQEHAAEAKALGISITSSPTEFMGVLQRELETSAV
jgi:CheY-like chemotaxis protein